MKYRLGVAVSAALFLATGISTARCLAADVPYSVEVLNESPPEALAEPIRNILGTTGYRVQDAEGGVVCDVWLRHELVVNPSFQPTSNVSYGFARSHLLGAIRFPEGGGSDLREQSLKPGVYTMRYTHQPIDGNHLGTWPYQDFVALCSPEKDNTAEDRDEQEVMDISMAGRTHPAILSLMPPAKESTPPTMVHGSVFGEDLWILLVEAPARAGDNAQPVRIALEVVGSAGV